MLSLLLDALRGVLIKHPDKAALSRAEISAKREIPFEAQIDYRTVRTPEGDYVRTFLVEGIPFECVDDSDINGPFRQWNNTIRVINRMCDGKITFYTHFVRRRSNASARAEFEPGYADDLNHRYAEHLSHIQLYESEHYLTIQYRVAPEGVLPFINKRKKLSPRQRAIEDKLALDEFDEITNALMQGLSRYGLKPLVVYKLDEHKEVEYQNAEDERADRRTEVQFSKQLEFYHYLINGFNQRVKVPKNGKINERLLTARPIMKNKLGVMNGDVPVYFGMLGVDEYPNEVFPGVLDDLLNTRQELVFTQSFSLIPRERARTMMKRHNIHMEQAGDDAHSETDAVEARVEGGALNDLAAKAFEAGFYHATLMVKGRSPKEIKDLISYPRSLLANAGFIAKSEWWGGLSASFWANLPGNTRLNPRPVPLTSLDFAALSPFHRYVHGKPYGNHWGEYLALLHTASGDPYYLNLHNGEVGNTYVFGPIGSGKTVLLTFICANLQRFNATGIVFDYKRGMELGIRALGGNYFELRNGERTGCNPFQMAETLENKTFIHYWVRSLLEQEGKTLTVPEQEKLTIAVDGVFTLEKKERRLARVLDGINPDSDLGGRLKQWVNDGPKAWVFDNETDDIDLKAARLTGFDMTQLLDNKLVRRPLMTYLFFRMRLLIGHGRMFTVIDEFWKALDDEYFVEELKTRTKTTRSQDWFFIVATQTVADAVRSPIFPTIVDNFATKILLPNPNAKHEDYVVGLELNEEEFKIVQELPLDSHLALIKQGSDSAVVLLDLAGMWDDLVILSPTELNVRRLDAIRKERGDRPKDWMPELLRVAGGGR